jgi:hypothetical protein
MRDGGHHAAGVWHGLRQSYLVAPELRVVPRLPLPVDNLGGDIHAEPPALIKGYLKCGGKLLGAPAWDPDFCTADLPMMLILVGVIGGLLSVGLVGLFIGPVILGISYTLLRAWIDEQDPPAA